MNIVFKKQSLRYVGKVAPFVEGPENQRGTTLLEVLIGIAILGLIIPAFLGAMSIGSQATAVSQERTTAESLARTQLEALKGSAYIDYGVEGHDDYATVNAPEGYSIEIVVVSIDPDTHEPLPAGEDEGLQEINVEIYHQANLVLTLSTYKANL